MTHPKRDGGLDRRTFLKHAAGVGGFLLAVGAQSTRGAGAVRRRPAAWADQIGVQLYTVRDKMEDDFVGTIEKVAALGYKEVEFAGYYDHSPAEVRQLLDRLGLRAPSAHVGLEALREDLDGQLASAQTIGHTYITVPAIPGAFGGQVPADQWTKLADEFNQLGKACRDRDLRFAYHNHAFEFAPAGSGKTGYDVLLEQTDPDLVDYEMDLMWTVFAGQDPVAWFKRYPGRFVMWHVKDMKEIEAARAAGEGDRGAVMGRIAAVGEGEIDFGPIFAHAEQAGLQHFFVENDAPEESLENIQTSYRNLTQLLAKG